MIILINPNSSASMTKAMVDTASAAVPSARIEGWTSHDGPPAIQGASDGLLATPPLLKLVGKASDLGAKAIIIGCFDDTALGAARAMAHCPVIGIGQAAYHLAAMCGARFSVVTTLDVSVPILETNISAYGLAQNLAKVRASDVPVLALEDGDATAQDRVLREIQTAVKEDHIDSVVLGCGGMVTLRAAAAATTGIKVIDGVQAAAVNAALLAHS
ncbi:aspartate/glutamate racemase family protein [Loktanella agnita]|uniref:aspartate/glutamate racemase family protein n=1 Tax=Loktanella agnita TaxID=287097 RepID=UPI0039880B4F